MIRVMQTISSVNSCLQSENEKPAEGSYHAESSGPAMKHSLFRDLNLTFPREGLIHY